MANANHTSEMVFPTSVGVILLWITLYRLSLSIPHECGVDPMIAVNEIVNMVYSLYRWG